VTGRTYASGAKCPSSNPHRVWVFWGKALACCCVHKVTLVVCYTEK
jgi:hypothetical protein